MTDFVQVAHNCLQKQYAGTNIHILMGEKAKIWNKHFGDISKRLTDEILDYNTCVPDALDFFWGRILKISRRFVDEEDNLFDLTDDQFRTIIKIRAFGIIWDGSVMRMNAFLRDIFGDRGRVYMIDRQDMTLQIIGFDFELEPWESWLFRVYDIFPRPAGVKTDIREFANEQFFGFAETNFFLPFDNAPFKTEV